MEPVGIGVARMAVADRPMVAVHTELAGIVAARMPAGDTAVHMELVADTDIVPGWRSRLAAQRASA